MIASYLRLAGLALLVSLLALTIRKEVPDLALALTLGGCALAAGLLLSYVEPVLTLGRSLADRAGLDGSLTGPLWKCLGLSLITRVAAAVCADAGQSALSKLVELGGGLLCLWVSLPLLQGVLALIEELL